jgi:hypothetical protein
MSPLLHKHVMLLSQLPADGPKLAYRQEAIAVAVVGSIDSAAGCAAFAFAACCW